MKEQKLIEGWGSIKKISSLLYEGKYKKALLITGKRSFDNSPGKDALFNALSGIEYKIFNDFQINPKYEDVLRGIEVYDQLKPDLIIAIGGGTVMDMAKLINALASVSGVPSSYILGENKLTKVARPMVAIPTTSGTGSEATHFAVVYLDGSKYSLAHPAILPDFVVLDSELTVDMPAFITACTGMDALCQGIESFWSVNSTEESLNYSRRAIELAVKYLVKAVKDPDRESREALQQAAYYAGKGINIAKTTAAHAFSYYITSKYGTPHGQAVGLLMGWIFQNNLGINDGNCTDSRGPEYVKIRMTELCKILKIDKPAEAESYFDDLLDVLSLKSETFILNNETKTELFKAVNQERLKNNPVEVN